MPEGDRGGCSELSTGCILDTWCLGRRRLRNYLRVFGRSTDLHVGEAGLSFQTALPLGLNAYIFTRVEERSTSYVANSLVLGGPGILASLLINRPSTTIAEGGFVPYQET